jgi:glycyl-tRNA synthetase
MKFHPRLAPFKAAILPLMKKNGQPEAARELVDTFLKAGINVSYDEQQSIGKRYARHDEIGTPYCITIDQDTIDNKTVTIRDRDTTEQIVVPISETLGIVQKKLA